VYVAEGSYNPTNIRRISPDGIINKFATASLGISAMAADMAGNVYVISGASVLLAATDRREQAESGTARMHASEESDRGVVAGRPA